MKISNTETLANTDQDEQTDASLTLFLKKLEMDPSTIQFTECMDVIEKNYGFRPTAFRNGSLENDKEQNQGSCKIFAFGKRHKLNQEQTLACFGKYYREDVLQHPDGNDHGNIRSFIKTGWDGIEFFGAEPVLTPLT